MPDEQPSLLTSLVTTEDAQSLLREVELLLPSVYKTQQGNFLDTLNKNVRITTKNALTMLLEQKNIPYTDTERLHGFLTELKTSILVRPILDVTIPFDPTEETVTTLATWLEENNIKEALINITVDRRLLAGSILSFNGKYKDYSLSQQLMPRIQQIGREILTGTV